LPSRIPVTIETTPCYLAFSVRVPTPTPTCLLALSTRLPGGGWFVPQRPAGRGVRRRGALARRAGRGRRGAAAAGRLAGPEPGGGRRRRQRVRAAAAGEPVGRAARTRRAFLRGSPRPRAAGRTSLSPLFVSFSTFPPFLPYRFSLGASCISLHPSKECLPLSSLLWPCLPPSPCIKLGHPRPRRRAP
jgi:hypothetical protein